MNTKAANREPRTVYRKAFLQRRLLPVLVAGCFGSAVANPLGPQVVNGQASFVNQGNLLSITNTPGAIINWQSFSINPGEITRFIQQNPNSAVLNRIVGQDPSQILGALQSNGRVFLINPNGILFGQGAQVDVNGLVASTLNISNEDFLKGRLEFKAGDKAADLKNQGAITTPAGGQVYLIAPNVENSGIITSPKGEVLLAAGHSVQLVDSLNPDLRVVVSAPENEALNLGQIIAQGGKTGIYGALVKQRGIVNANSAVVGENGKIVFKASRDTLLEAGSQTTATGAGKGGEIRLLGDRVGLSGARVDASGEQGGGSILIGGDFQGKNSDVPNAKATFVGKDVEIKADAIVSGDGGKVIIWADETTQFHGKTFARGGAQSGNGGFVETSGKQHLEYRGKSDLSAANGEMGVLLLDPATIEIIGGPGDGDSNNTTSFGGTGGTTQVVGQITFANGNTGPSTVYQTEIEGQSSTAHIILEATDKIFTSGDFTNDELLLAANRNLTLRTRNSDIDPSGPIGIDLTGSVEGASLGFRTQGTGTITMQTGSGTNPWEAPILLNKLQTASGAINVSATGNVTINEAVSSTSGSIAISGKNLTVGAAITTANSTTLSLTATDAATLNANVIAGDSSTLTVQAANNIVLGSGTLVGGAGTDIILSSTSGNISQTGMTVDGDTLSATASMGSVTLTSSNMVDKVKGSGKTGFSFNNNQALSVHNDGVTSEANVSITTGAGANDITLDGAVKTTSTTGIVGISAGSTGKILRSGATATIEANTINLQNGSTGGVGASGSPLYTTSVGSNLSTITIGNASGSKDVDVAYLAHTGNALLSASSLFDAAATIDISSSGNLRAMADVSTTSTVKYESGGLLEIDGDSTITASGVTLIGDHIDIQGGAGQIDVGGSGTVTLKSKTTGLGIDIGSTANNGSALEISDAEIDAITAGTVDIGAADAGDVTVSTSITTAGKHISVTGNNITIESGRSIATGAGATGGNITLTAAGAVTFDGGLTTNAQTPGNIMVSAQGDISINEAIQATDLLAPSDSTQVSFMTAAGDIMFNGAGAVSATGGAGTVKLMATNGSITAATNNTTVVSAPNAILKARYGIHGPVSGGNITNMQVDVSGLDVSNTSSGDIRISNVTPGTMSVIDLDADNDSIVQGDLSSDVVISTANDLTVDNDTSILGIGTYELSAGGTLTVDTPIDGGSGAVSLAGTAVTVNEAVSAYTVKVATDTLTVDPGTGSIEATGIPGSSSPGGMYVSPYASAAITIGTGAGLDIDPLKLKSAAPAPGEIASGYYEFNAGSTGTVNVSSAIGLANSDLAFKAGTVNLSDDVVGKSISYHADTLSVAATATSTASGTNEGILIAPWTASKGITIEPGDPGSVLWIDSDFIGNFIGTWLEFGDFSSSTGEPIGSGSIAINGPIAGTSGTFRNLGFSTSGTITQNASGGISLPGYVSATCDPCGELHIYGGTSSGVATLNAATNSIDYLMATAGAVLFSNNKDLEVGFARATLPNGDVNISAAGNITSTGAIKAHGGDITVTATGASHDITINAPGINGCYDVSGACGSAVTLDATGSITVPLVNAGSSVTLNAGGDVIDGDGSLLNITAHSGSVTLNYNVGGNIDLDAWGATMGTRTAGGVDSVRWTVPSSGGGGGDGGGGSTAPTLAQCTSDPTMPGCSTVLPTLSTCTTAPTTAGCSAVLPSLDSCVVDPTKSGCSAVLPTLSACTANPAQSGCSVVLPSMDACVIDPTKSGCSAVLPSLDACVVDPTKSGCSVVLPTLSACTANPAQSGCSVVLPSMDACVADPTKSGCSAVLPTLSACIANPSQSGCSVVLPSMDACVVDPTKSGCSAVLPTLSACTANPAQSGCSVVLPSMAACVADPAKSGCNAVLPSLSTCTTAPTTVGCNAVLPTLDTCTVAPATAGCSAVLPTLSACITAPATAGCTAVLPTIDVCTANPTQTGCTVVLPKFDSCTVNPVQAGCSVVLPSLDSCMATPNLAGCQAVLPSLEQCSANPNQQGCSVVVATTSKCVATPNLPECTTVLPGNETSDRGTNNNPGTGSPSNTATTITSTVTKTVNTVVTTTVAAQASTVKVRPGSGTSSGGGGSSARTTAEKPSEKAEDKKDDKKTTSTVDDSGAKKNEPAKKLYCN